MSSKRDSGKQNLGQREQTFKILMDYVKFSSKIYSLTKTGWQVHTPQQHLINMLYLPTCL